MDVERTENFYPIVTLTEDVEKIVLMKAALIAITDEHERSFLSVQNRLKAGKRQIDVCTHKSNSLDLKINAVETKITETLLSNQASEAETLSTVQENRILKRKIIALKHDMERQEKLLQRASETLNVVNNCVKKKKPKELSTMKMVILMNYPAPTEGIHHVESNVTAFYKQKSLGKGTLYIAESLFCWISTSGEGFSLKYPSIYIHAVSRDLSNFPQECLYLMIDANIVIGEEEEPHEIASALNNLSVDEGAEGDDDVDRTVEMYFVPDNHNMLDVMFRALSDCQALNPDPDEKSDEDDEAVVAPPFSVQEGNGFHEAGEEIEYEIEEYKEEMNEEQFEDADQ